MRSESTPATQVVVAPSPALPIAAPAPPSIPPTEPELPSELPEAVPSPPPAPVVKDDLYRHRLWSTLPPPTAPPATPLSPLPAEKVKALRIEINKCLTKNSAGKRATQPRYKKGEPANVWDLDNELSVIKPPYQKHKPEFYARFKAHLNYADDLFQDDNPAVRTSGLGIVYCVLTSCINQIKDFELAAYVADAYLIPELKHADANTVSHLSEYHLLETASTVYSNAKRFEMEEQIAGRAIELKAANRNIADTWRTILAMSLKDQGKWDHAHAVLDDIHDPSVIGLKEHYHQKLEQARLNPAQSEKPTPKPRSNP